MLRLKLVRNQEDESQRTSEEERELPHGTVVLRRTFSPWAGTYRTVCTNSYSVSVEAAFTISAMGMHFIGVVKTASRKFLISYLARLSALERGESVSMVHKDVDGRAIMMDLKWVDNEQRYFISTRSNSKDGTLYKLVRWSHTGSFAKILVLTVRQSEVSDISYSSCSYIYKHNR